MVFLQVNNNSARDMNTFLSRVILSATFGRNSEKGRTVRITHQRGNHQSVRSLSTWDFDLDFTGLSRGQERRYVGWKGHSRDGDEIRSKIASEGMFTCRDKKKSSVIPEAPRHRFALSLTLPFSRTPKKRRDSFHGCVLINTTG